VKGITIHILGDDLGLLSRQRYGAVQGLVLVARESLERWAHHSQIRRALGHPSLADSPILEIDFRIIATVAGMPAGSPTSTGQGWSIGPIVLGDARQAADILTLTYTEHEVQALIEGPKELVAQFASRRRPPKLTPELEQAAGIVAGPASAYPSQPSMCSTLSW
jgi:hypothetical protein